MSRNVLIILVIGALVVVGIFVLRPSDMGKKLPGVSLRKAANTEGVPTLEDLKGKVVLIEFWATTCGHCRSFIPRLIDMYEKFKDRGLVIVAITNEDELAVDAMIDAMSIPYIVGYDDDGQTAKAYKVSRVPQVFLAGRDGTLLWKGHPMSLGEDVIEKALAKADAKQSE